MNNWNTIHEETRDGFNIILSVAPEDTHPKDSFDPECFDIEQLCEDINSGNYAWFVARVQAFRAGVELASDYLGGCLYDAPEDFVTARDYYEDMVRTVIEKARIEVPRLIASLND